MVVWCIYSSYSLRTSSERSFFFLLQEVTRACRQHANQSLGHGIFIPEKIIEVVSLVWHPPQLPSCCRRHKLIDDWFHWRRKKNKVFESSPILPYRSYRSTKSYGSSCWAHSILTIYIWRWTMNTMLRTMTLETEHDCLACYMKRINIPVCSAVSSSISLPYLIFCMNSSISNTWQMKMQWY